MAPVNAESPAVAIGEPAAGVKSKSLMLVGVAPTAGMAVKSEAAVAALSVRLFAVASSANCVAGVAVLAWKIFPFVSANTMFLTCRSAVALGVWLEPART